MDYGIFNVRDWSFGMHIHMGSSVYYLIRGTYVESAQDLTLEKSQGSAWQLSDLYPVDSNQADGWWRNSSR